MKLVKKNEIDELIGKASFWNPKKYQVYVNIPQG